jgi:hypothetical protein
VIDISQIAIPCMSLPAMWLANDHRPEVRKWGCVLGMLSEPFWFYTTIVNHQWGIFFAAFFYTYAWVRGFYNQWLR